MKTSYLILFIALLFASCSSSESLQIQEVWARPADEGGNSAVYFTISGGNSEDALIDVKSKIAAKTEIHESILGEDGTARMEHIDTIPIPPQTEILLQPGGFHIMLRKLNKSLTPGDIFDLTLIFEYFGEVILDVPVRTP